MKLSDFDFNLPPELIAQYPLEKRSASRLLYLDKETGLIQHRKFIDLTELISPNDLLICNDTKVIPARLLGQKLTGAKVEFLIEKILNANQILTHIKSNKPLKNGTQILIADKFVAKVIERQDDLFIVEFTTETIQEILEQVGQIPLPPYIQRTASVKDQERYQTIFAKHKGAVAAPTAGLHFDAELFTAIHNRHIDIAYVTLHVGAGTFQPIRTEKIHEHKMHFESVYVPTETCAKIKAAKARGGKIIAVGTTVVRAIETAAKSGEIQSCRGETNIFIFPGYEFKCIDALITNFHLPKSTLLLLVSAFAGFDNIMHAYQEAIKNQYRFFSYGDAMLII